LNYFPKTVRKQIGFLTVNSAIDVVVQASNIAAENNNLEEREIKRRPGVFWKNNIGISQQVKAMKAKAVTHFMHRSKASEINKYQKCLVSPKRNHCDIRRYHRFWWVVNSTDMLVAGSEDSSFLPG
jgi:hypothetical protein